MGKLSLVELVDKNLESNIRIFGFQNFFNSIAEGKKGEVDYYCFEPPEIFLVKSNAKIPLSFEDIYSSHIFLKFFEKSYEFFNWRYPNHLSGFEEFKDKYHEIERKLTEKKDELVNSEGEERVKKINSILRFLPFFSNFWVDHIECQNHFLSSDFQVKYFEDLKEEVGEYRRDFLGKTFDWQAYNRYIFEKKYELFSEIPLKF